MLGAALSSAQEERARKLHTESIIIDLVAQHIGGSNIFKDFPPELRDDLEHRLASANGWDALIEAEYWPYQMSLKGRSNLIRDWYIESGLTCGTYGIGVHDGHDATCLKLEAANRVFANLPWLRCVTTASEIRKAKKDAVVALYAHWQPYIPAPRSLAPIDVAYSKGLRSFMLTYNQMDSIGVGCTERVDAGLSMFGLDVIRHCNDIGMMVDVSHCGQSTTMDACRHSKKPVNANHTSALALCGHARAKNDEALKAIADTGGVIGVLAVPAFITTDREPRLDHMLDHIEYIADLVGWQHVAIGTDWPMQAPLEVLRLSLEANAESIGFRDEDRLDMSAKLQGFDDGRDLPNITRGLVSRGYSDQEIKGILGENALRVFEAVCG
jgi:membrane dipeptidase